MKFSKIGIFVLRRVLPLLALLIVILLLLFFLFFDSLAQAALEKATRTIPGNIAVKRFSPTWRGVKLQDIEWTLETKEPVFEASEIDLVLNLSQLFADDWSKLVQSTTIRKPGLRVVVDPNGNLNLINLIPPTPETPVIDVALVRTEVMLEDGWILYKDRRNSAGFLYELSGVSARFALTNGRDVEYTIAGLPNRAAESGLSIKGRALLESPGVVTDVDLQNVELGPFAGFPGFGPGLTLVEGILDASIRASGEGERWDGLLADLFLVGEAKLSKGAFQSPKMPAPLRELEGRLKLVGSEVAVEAASGRFAGIFFEASGHGALGGGSVAASVSTERFSLEALNSLLAEPLPIAGEAEFLANLKGSLESPVASGTVKGYDLTSNGETVKTAAAKFLYSGNLLYLSEMSADTSAGAITADGWVFIEDDPYVLFDIKGRGTRPDVLLADSAQQADFDVKVMGTSQFPIAYGSGVLSGLGSWSQGVSRAEGSFLFSGSDLMLYNGLATVGMSSVRLPLGALDLQKRTFSGILSTLDFQGSDLPGIVGLNGQFSGSALVGADFSQDEPQLEVQGILTSGTLSQGDLEISQASGEFFLDGEQLVMASARGVFEGTQLQASGVYDTGSDSVQGFASASGFDMSSVGGGSGTADLLASVQGSLGGTLGVYGVASADQGKAAVSAYRQADGQVAGVAWLDGEQDGVEVKGTLVASGTPEDLELDYNAEVMGAQLNGFGPVDLFGSARLLGKVLTVNPTVLAANDVATDHNLYPLTTYTGAAYEFFGPFMSGPLEKVVLTESPFPKGRSLLVAGNANVETRAVNLGFQASAAGLEELPFSQALELLPFEILGGFGTFDGRIGGTLTSPTVEADFLLPWMLLGKELDTRLTMGLRGRLEFARNTLKLKGGILSEVPFDSRLTSHGKPEQTEGLLALKGSMQRDGNFDLRVSTDGFAPGFFAFFGPRWARPWAPSGKVATDSLHLWGTPYRPSISGAVTLVNGALMVAGAPYPIESGFVDFSSQNGNIRVPRLGMTVPGLALSGSVSRMADGQLGGRIFADDIDLEKLHRFGGLFAGLDGEADLLVELDGKFPQSPLARVGLRTQELSWNPHVLAGRDGVVSIETLVLGQFGEGDDPDLVSGLTVASTESGIFLELPEEGFRFSRSEDGLQVSLSGAVELQPTMQTFKTFRQLADYFVSPDGPDFGHQGVPLKLDVDNLTTREIGLLLGRDVEDTEVTTSFAVSLEGQWWRDHKLRAGAHLPHYNLAFDNLMFESGKLNERSGVQLDTEASVDYQRDGEAGYLTLSGWQFGFFRDGVEEAAEKGSKPSKGTEGAPESQTARIIRQGVINAAGRLAITALPGTFPESTFQLGATDIPLANLSFLLPDNLPLSGLIESLEIDLDGVLPSPQFSIGGLISNLRVGPFDKMRLEGSIDAGEVDGGYRIVVGKEENTGVALTFGDKSPEDHSVRLDGDTDLFWIREPNPNLDRLELFGKNLTVSLDSPLNLSLDVLDENLEILSMLVPGPVKSAGTFVGDLRAYGTLRRPEFEGKALLQDGLFDSKLFGRFEALNLDAKISRISREEAVTSPVLEASSSGFLTHLQFDRLEGLLGKQPFFGGGTAEFAGIRPTFLDLFFVGESLPVKIAKLFTGTVDVDLEIDGKLAEVDGAPVLRPILQGLLVVPSGEFVVPLDGLSSSAEAEAPPDVPLDISLDISLGRNFFVRALDARIRAVGDLLLTTEKGVAKVYGQTDLSRGTISIPFSDATFQVRQGLAKFDGPMIPVLEAVEAVTEMGGYRITARASGRYPDTFKLDLYSAPPLPQAQLSRTLLLGGLPSQITGNSDAGVSPSSGTVGSLSDQGVAFLSGIVTNKLTNKLGKIFFLSDLSVDYIPPATFAVKLAKALDPNDKFLLTLTRITRETGLTENLFGLEWRFSRQVLTRIAYDDLGQIRLFFQSFNRF